MKAVIGNLPNLPEPSRFENRDAQNRPDIYPLKGYRDGGTVGWGEKSVPILFPLL